ncbi:MAG TPA: DNA recombination protein RmuC, partial [Alphaproteobacteria bacterium]|nr:DNA recombination protein RmuC [Alphaproteobacteria bacterium]
DVRRLGERVDNLQKHFTDANEDIRQIGISRDKVTKRAERIEELEFETPGAPAPLAGSERPTLAQGAGRSEAESA